MRFNNNNISIGENIQMIPKCEICGKAKLLATVDGIRICGECRENKK